jgi:hypothetical protein
MQRSGRRFKNAAVTVAKSPTNLELDKNGSPEFQAKILISF